MFGIPFSSAAASASTSITVPRIGTSVWPNTCFSRFSFLYEDRLPLGHHLLRAPACHRRGGSRAVRVPLWGRRQFWFRPLLEAKLRSEHRIAQSKRHRLGRNGGMLMIHVAPAEDRATPRVHMALRVGRRGCSCVLSLFCLGQEARNPPAEAAQLVLARPATLHTCSAEGEQREMCSPRRSTPPVNVATRPGAPRQRADAAAEATAEPARASPKGLRASG